MIPRFILSALPHKVKMFFPVPAPTAPRRICISVCSGRESSNLILNLLIFHPLDSQTARRESALVRASSVPSLEPSTRPRFAFQENATSASGHGDDLPNR
jgi:hypothetical protein